MRTTVRPLPAGHVVAPATDRGVEPVGQAADPVLQPDPVQHVVRLSVVGPGSSQQQVCPQRGVEDMRVLGREADDATGGGPHLAGLEQPGR